MEGAHEWTPTMYIRLVQDFGLECEVAQHLSNSYGDRAFSVAKLAALTGNPEFVYMNIMWHCNFNQQFVVLFRTEMANHWKEIAS